jgi:hypothetical protein
VIYTWSAVLRWELILKQANCIDSACKVSAFEQSGIYMVMVVVVSKERIMQQQQ